MERFGGQGSGEYDNVLIFAHLKPTGCTWKGSLQKFIKKTFFPDGEEGMPSKRTVGMKFLEYRVSCIIAIDHIDNHQIRRLGAPPKRNIRASKYYRSVVNARPGSVINNQVIQAAIEQPLSSD